MANDIAANPWSLDTVGATIIWPSWIKVAHFEMIDYTVDTDTVQLQDRNGRVVWEGNGASDLRPIVSMRVGWINGLVFAASNNAATRVRVYLGDK